MMNGKQAGIVSRERWPEEMRTFPIAGRPFLALGHGGRVLTLDSRMSVDQGLNELLEWHDFQVMQQALFAI